MAEKTTTHFALPSPTSAGEVKNGAVNIEELANKVDEVLYEGNKVANGQVYGAKTEKTSGTEYEPSASRPTFVVLTAENPGVGSGDNIAMVVYVGGVIVCEAEGNGGAVIATVTASIIVPAGKKWKATIAASVGSPKVFASYLPL